VLTFSLVMVVSSVTNDGMVAFGLTNSKNIASSSGIPFGSKICAATFDDFVTLLAPSCSLQVKNNIENLVQINCRGVPNNCCNHRRHLGRLLNTVISHDLLLRCCTGCSSGGGWAVATIMPCTTTATTLSYLGGCLTLTDLWLVWRWHGGGDIAVNVNEVSTGKCKFAPSDDMQLLNNSTRPAAHPFLSKFCTVLPSYVFYNISKKGYSIWTSRCFILFFCIAKGSMISHVGYDALILVKNPLVL
jgi:hypothetical protein